MRSDCKSTGDKAKGGVCLYYKDHLPIKRRKDLELLDESIVVEIVVKRKKIIFSLFYRSPSQTHTEFSNFMKKIALFYEKALLENPSAVILTGDFNARSPLFWKEESRQTLEGKSLGDFCLLNGLHQLIDEPTHLPREDIETCIDLILTNQPFAFVDSGVIPSPDPLCKHQIIHGNLNFSVPCPPPYKRKLWKYHLADIPRIRERLLHIDWKALFINKTPDVMVTIFSDLFLKIMVTFIPNKVVSIDDKDAPWVTPEVKKILLKNRKLYSKWVKEGRNAGTREAIKKFQIETNRTINQAKSKYITDLSDKLCDPTTGSKAFHSALKKLANKKKITNIPPLLENGVFISNFKDKSDIFNKYFAAQCRPLVSESVLPPLSLRTDSTTSAVAIHEDAISSIINKLNSKKAHGYDGISIPMLKLCSVEVAKPLSLIFKRCLDTGKFPSSWKYANVQPVHKKNSRQEKTNYRPISLLPICSKIFEKVIFDSLYSYLLENGLLTKNQSGFRPGDSTVNQLLSITTEIYNSFETLDETRAVFLDISKAFDKVWHEGLAFKLKENGVKGKLLEVIENFLSNRKQRVVLNGIESSWEQVHSGVPQGSVLGPLLFLVYINDLTDGISSNIKLFADDSSLFIKVRDIDTAQRLLSTDLETITSWAHQWKMQFNPDITKQAIEVIFSSKYKKVEHPPLFFNEIPVAREDSTKHLGIILDSKLNFRKHILEALDKAKNGLSLMKFLAKYLNRNCLELTYKMHVRPYLEYGDVLFHECSRDLMSLLESIQYQAGLITSGCWQGTNRGKLYKELGWESLADRRKLHRLSLYFKIKTNEAPEYLNQYVLRSLPQGTDRYNRTFFPYCFREWDLLSPEQINAKDPNSFKVKFLKNIRPEKRKTFKILDRHGLKLLTRLRVDFSDLRCHRFDHNFNCDQPICKCGIEEESTDHYLLRCPRFVFCRDALFESISSAVTPEILNLPHDHLTDILLFGSKMYNEITCKLIIEACIRFIKKSERFKTLEAYTE